MMFMVGDKGLSHSSNTNLSSKAITICLPGLKAAAASCQHNSNRVAQSEGKNEAASLKNTTACDLSALTLLSLLSLNQNQIGPAGGEALAAALTKNKTLTRLELVK